MTTRQYGEKDMPLFTVPYSHMDERDEALYYGTLDELLTYANQALGILDEPSVSLHGDDERLLGYGAVVSEELWRHRWVIDDFVGTNPLGVTREHLEVARLWRHAVHDIFTCIDANADYALYMNGRRVFAVGAMRGDADSHVHAIPSLMLLTLLPFRGGIVTDSKTFHLSSEPAPGALPLIARQTSELMGAGVVSTAAQLVAYERAHRGESQISRSCQRAIDAHLAQLRHLGEPSGTDQRDEGRAAARPSRNDTLGS